MPSCRQFQRTGKCQKGDRCRFHHPTQLCRFAPNCRRSDEECTFAHFSPSGQAAKHKPEAKSKPKIKPKPKAPDASSSAVALQQPLATSCSPSLRLDHRREDGSRVQAHVERLRTTLVFVVSLDVSGSMHGSRLTKAVACLDDIYHKVMREHDHYGCYLFHNNVEKLHGPMRKSRVDWDQDQRNILKHSGGGTALYDAIIQGVQDITVFDFKDKGPNHKYVVEHLVITDGADNSSRSNVHTTGQTIERSRVGNYHLNIISIGICESNEASMHYLARSQHVHYYPVQDMVQFEQRMKAVAKQIRARIRITASDGSVQDVQFEGDSAAAQAALPQLAQVTGLEGLLGNLMLAFRGL